MSRTERASSLLGRPVVTFAGDSPGLVKDVLLGQQAGELLGFTVKAHGLLARHVGVLRWDQVHAVGRDAVVIETVDALEDAATIETGSGGAAGAGSQGGSPQILGIRVVTENGHELGHVRDAVLELGPRGALAGYELETAEALPPAGRRVLLPFSDACRVSDEALLVPAEAMEYVRDDMAGLGAASNAFVDEHVGGGR